MSATSGVSAWSYSSLTAYETCPRRFYMTRISKEVVEKQTAATLHGNEVHKALEDAVSRTRPLPEKYSQYSKLVDAVAATPGIKHTEMSFGLTRAFQPTKFFAPDVWCRGKIDVAIVRPSAAVLLDWKTGKPKSDDDQLSLFAAAAMAHWPTVESVKVGYVWLGFDKLTTTSYVRESLPSIWGAFLPRVERMERAITTGVFPPKPSGLCKAYCPVPKHKCEFSGAS